MFISLSLFITIYFIYKIGSLSCAYKAVIIHYKIIKDSSEVTNREALIQALEYRSTKSPSLRNNPNGIDPIIEYLDSFEKSELSIFNYEDIMLYIAALQVWQAENNLVLDDEWGKFRSQQIEDIKSYLVQDN